MRRTKIAIFGSAGVVASVCIRGLAERNADIVAGFELREIGKDLGLTAGIGRLGVAAS